MAAHQATDETNNRGRQKTGQYGFIWFGLIRLMRNLNCDLKCHFESQVAYSHRVAGIVMVLSKCGIFGRLSMQGTTHAFQKLSIPGNGEHFENSRMEFE